MTKWRQLVRVLTAYDGDGQLVAERVLPIALADLRRLFGGGVDDDMRGVYAVSSREASEIGELVGESVDAGGFDLYVESYELDDGD